MYPYKAFNHIDNSKMCRVAEEILWILDNRIADATLQSYRESLSEDKKEGDPDWNTADPLVVAITFWAR